MQNAELGMKKRNGFSWIGTRRFFFIHYSAFCILHSDVARTRES